MKKAKELFLYHYFSAVTPFGSSISKQKAKEVFSSLAKAYLIDEALAKETWQAVDSERISQIGSYKDYLRYCRMVQYAKDVMQVEVDDSLLQEMASIKGSALSKLVELAVIDENEDGVERTVDNIVNRAGEGIVAALDILGVLQIHGIHVDRDAESGVKNLKRAAKWNDVSGAMTYLYYSQEDRQEVFDSLMTVLQMRYDSSLTRALRQAYPQLSADYKRNAIASLIEKTFNASILKREECLAPITRILHSQIIPYQDKEQALYSIAEKQRRLPICDLPLKLKPQQKFQLDARVFEADKICRANDLEKILQEANNFDLRTISSYTPLCICAESGIQLGYYVTALAGLLSGANIRVIEVSELTKSDIEPTSNNIFVRSCDEDRANAYILSFRGVIEAEAINFARDFLRTAKRKTFGLVSPAVQLDLSGILPVCICDRANVRYVKKLCNVVNVEGMSNEEKGKMIEDLLNRKAELYGMGQISIDEDAKQLLIDKLSFDDVSKALDKVILANRLAGSLTLDTSKIKSVFDEFKTVERYGFGNSII